MLSHRGMLQQINTRDTMHFLQWKLENEEDLYAKRLAEGRTDLLGQILLKRIEQEIKRIEGEIRREETIKANNGAQRESASGFIHYVKKTLRRYWTNCYLNNSTISRIPSGTTLQAKEGAACEIRH